MVEELVRSPDIFEPLEGELRDNSTELPTSCGDPVCCRAVSRGERLTRDDERCRVRAEVLEEVRHAVQHDECGLAS